MKNVGLAVAYGVYIKLLDTDDILYAGLWPGFYVTKDGFVMKVMLKFEFL